MLKRWASEGRGVAVALAGQDDDLTVAAAGSAGPAGGSVEPGSAFRVGSLWKTFVAVTLLQLVHDGTIGLDDLVVRQGKGGLGDAVSAGNLMKSPRPN